MPEDEAPKAAVLAALAAIFSSVAPLAVLFGKDAMQGMSRKYSIWGWGRAAVVMCVVGMPAVLVDAAKVSLPEWAKVTIGWMENADGADYIRSQHHYCLHDQLTLGCAELPSFGAACIRGVVELIDAEEHTEQISVNRNVQDDNAYLAWLGCTGGVSGRTRSRALSLWLSLAAAVLWSALWLLLLLGGTAYYQGLAGCMVAQTVGLWLALHVVAGKYSFIPREWDPGWGLKADRPLKLHISVPRPREEVVVEHTFRVNKEEAMFVLGKTELVAVKFEGPLGILAWVLCVGGYLGQFVLLTAAQDGILAGAWVGGMMLGFVLRGVLLNFETIVQQGPFVG